MTAEEPDREFVFDRLEELLGREAAAELMRMVPLMRWEELATKKDLEALKAWLAQRFAERDRRFDALEGRFGHHDRRFDKVDARFELVMQQFETTDEHIGRAKHEVIAVVRGELLTAVTGQTRQLIFTMGATVAAIGAMAVALARFG